MDARTILAELTRILFAPVCHQGGGGLGFCARCFGLHVAIALGWWGVTAARSILADRATSVLLLLAPAAMLVHWALGVAGAVEPGTVDRLVSGAAAGASLGALGALRYRDRRGMNSARDRASSDRASLGATVLGATHRSSPAHRTLALIVLLSAALPPLFALTLPPTALQFAASASLLSNLVILAVIAGLLFTPLVEQDHHGNDTSNPAA